MEDPGFTIFSSYLQQLIDMVSGYFHDSTYRMIYSETFQKELEDVGRNLEDPGIHQKLHRLLTFRCVICFIL